MGLLDARSYFQLLIPWLVAHSVCLLFQNGFFAWIALLFPKVFGDTRFLTGTHRRHTTCTMKDTGGWERQAQQEQAKRRGERPTSGVI